MVKRSTGSVESICRQCGKSFKTWPYLIRQGYGITCSRTCAAKKYPEGYQNCPTCKQLYPATTEYFHRNKSSCRKNKLHSQCKNCIRTTNAYTRARRINLIIERGSCCEVCGLFCEEPKFFDVDHILPVYKSGEKRKQYQFGDGSNFQVLCPNCHRFKTITELIEWEGYYYNG